MSIKSLIVEAERQRQSARRSLRAFTGNWKRTFKAPRGNRLPYQPWQVEAQPIETEVASVPAGPERPAVTPVAYDKTGIVPRDWPFRGSLPRFNLRVLKARDVTVLPRGVAFGPDRKLLKLSFAAENWVLMKTLGGRYTMRHELPAEIQLRLDRPAFVVDSCWSGVYGHFLLEILPTLLLQSLVPSDCLVLTSAPLTADLLACFECLGVARHRIRRLTAPVCCTEAYWGDPLSRLGGGAHPLIQSAYDRLRELGDHSEIECPERLFISRSGVRGRRLRQEAQVEALFAEKGFSVVRPELLPIADQIALFARAKVIAGLGGSAMHSAVFAKPDTPVLIVQTGNMSVATDLSLTPPERRLGYVFGATEQFAHPIPGPWTLDVTDVAVGIKAHFGI